jgi:hypothetical protein
MLVLEDGGVVSSGSDDAVLSGMVCLRKQTSMEY